MNTKKDNKSRQKLLRDFIGFMNSLGGEAQEQRFLEAILTPQELEEIPRRLEIVKMLQSGITQREISEKLGVGIATVTRGSRVMNEAVFKRLKK